MTARSLVRWSIFAAYTALFFVIPFYLVAEYAGLAIGVTGWILFLLFICVNGTDRISRRLGVRPMSRAEFPAVKAMVAEYCRRLRIPEPKLGRIASSAVNVGIFGFSRRRSYLVLTQGALDQLSRDQLSSLVARELSYYYFGDVPCEAWLSQFLWVFDKLLSYSAHKSTGTSRRIYTVKLFAKQILFFPLTLFPVLVLKGSRDARKIDALSIKLARKPNSLSGAFRKLEAMQERVPFHVSFGDRHLFLLPPRTRDPLTRVFFQSESFEDRVSELEALRQVVALS